MKTHKSSFVKGTLNLMCWSYIHISVWLFGLYCSFILKFI